MAYYETKDSIGNATAINRDLIRAITQFGTGDGTYCQVSFDKEHSVEIPGTLDMLLKALHGPPTLARPLGDRR